jgi:hypothetical protein
MSKQDYTPREKPNYKETVERLGKKLQDFSETQWKDVLRFMAHFHRYSWANQMWIHWQMPSATRVAGMHAWNKVKRKVMKGQKGLQIFIPYFKTDAATGEKKLTGFGVGYVWDVSQTEGEPLKDVASLITTSSIDVEGLWEILVKNAGCPVIMENLPHDTGGYYRPGKNGASEKIAINVANPRPQQFKTLIHELAHKINNDPKSDTNTEVIAESTAFCVCDALGLDTSDYSLGYITSWASGVGHEAVMKHGSAIQKTVSSIMKWFETVTEEAEEITEKAA